MKKPVLLSAAVLLLVFVGQSAQSNDNTYFKVVVNTPPYSIKNYNTFTAPNGSLFGGLIRLKMSDQGFDFEYKVNDDYGPFLISVNGLAGNSSHYWKLLSGTTPLDVGMGCYIPKANEVITLKYTSTQQDHLKFHSDL
ncbi:unnamed protein product [Oreochromis niloticus]|nr:unnamed protein product [Mustela putorius furo]